MVNNAGWTHRNRPMLEVTEAEFDKVYAVNVKSIYHMTQAVVPAGAGSFAGATTDVSAEGSAARTP